MRRALSPIILAILLAVVSVSVSAADLNLAGDRYWMVLASRQDADQAIAAAQNQFDFDAKVVRSGNGWFAAIAGPFTVAPGEGRAFLDSMIKTKNAPKDYYLTRGDAFVEVVWSKPATNVVDSIEYDGEHDATLRFDELQIKLSRKKAGDSDFDPIAVATYRGNPAFEMEFTENAASTPASKIQLIRLDAASPMPQVVFTYFWQGAHCCTMTKIATLSRDGHWRVIDADTLDGDGYAFEDILGKNFSYLVSVDNGFLYAFDSYADSAAPLRIQQLAGDRLMNVTEEPQLRHRLLQSLYAQEESARETEDDWRSNGFLAGWVASSILVGRGEAAWAKMLTTYDRHSDFAAEKCLTGEPIEKCPAANKVKLSFPYALRQFLIDHGYLKDAVGYDAPYEVEPDQRPNP